MVDEDARRAWDFFICYTPTDRQWAEWIGWVLEVNGGYRALLQDWNFTPGSNWIEEMTAGIRDTTRTIAILSDAYLASQYGNPEWVAAWAMEPVGIKHKLVTVRVTDCERPPLLAPIVGADLFGIDEPTAQARLLDMVARARAPRLRPAKPPRFPGVAVAEEPQVLWAHGSIAGHVFISYVREDSAEVDRLQRVLEASRIRVWRDTADLWPGEDWRAKIRQAITNDALVFLACFSHNSLARKRSYQNEELALAIEQIRLRPPGEPWLIPVRLDECDLPDVDIGGGRSLNAIQSSDLFGKQFDHSSARLTGAIVRILRR